MYIDDDGNVWESEEDFFDSLMQEESYHFSIPFEYIKRHLGDDEVEMGTTNMEVDVRWDYDEHSYRITYYVPEMDLIDPAEGNGNEDEFYQAAVEPIVLDRLLDLDIGYSALVGGIGY